MRRNPRRFAWALVALLGASLSACTDSPLGIGEQRDVSAIQMSANVSGTSISTLVVRVSAADIATPLAFNLEVVNGTATGTLKVPAGSQRLFEVKAYDTGGAITHEGSATADVSRGSNAPLSITLYARSGQVPVTITMGDYSVVVDPASATLTIGSTQQLSATVTGPDVDPTQVRWATSNPSIATVSASGLVTARMNGDVQIVATYGGVGGSSRITIGESFPMTTSGGTVTADGGKLTLVFPAGAVPENVHITVARVSDVSDPDILPGTAYKFQPSPYTFAEPVMLRVRYDPALLPAGTSESELKLFKEVNGIWEAIPGSTANTPEKTITASITSFSRYGVGRAKVHTVEVSPSSATVLVGQTQQFTAVLRDAAGNTLAGRQVNWKSGDEAVATVDQSGLATAVRTGTVTVTATSQGVGGTAEISVREAVIQQWQVERQAVTENPLHAVWGTSESNVYAVGLGGGTILRFNGTSWSPMTSGTTSILRAVWGTSESNVYAVGESGTILRFNGTSWSRMTSGTTSPLFAVWGTSESNVYAVGGFGSSSGNILRFDGTSWSPMTTSTRRLAAVWGTSESNVYAVGEVGTILRFDGTSWSPMTSGIIETLRAVWGTSESNVYAVGDQGTILHWNGTSWSRMTSGRYYLFGVWGTSTSTARVVGSGSRILRGMP